MILHKQKNKFDFTNSYSKLPKTSMKKNPTPVKKPVLLKLNNSLCDFLNLDKEFLNKKQGVFIYQAMRSLNHQNLYQWFMQGISSVIMLINWETVERSFWVKLKLKMEKLFDIQLKGSGKTHFQDKEMEGPHLSR